jgi:hypothetical protein
MKMFRVAAFAAALGATAWLSAISAQAVTLNLSTDLPAPITDADALADPTSTSGTVRIDFIGNNFDGVTPGARSPYEGTPFQNTAFYHSVSAGAEARYDFGSTQSQFGLLFGSPDSYNTLSFLLNGVEVYDLTGDALVPRGQLGLGAVYVMISDIAFDQVRMSSAGDAFEFTNLFSLAAIPVPASLPLLLGGLIGLRLLARRRRSSGQD